MPCLFVSSVFFTLIVIGRTVELEERFLKKNSADTPLAVIRERDSSELHLAIPHKHKNRIDIVTYFYDRLKEEFLTTCPAHTEKQLQIETKWKNESQLQGSKLYFSREYSDEEMQCEEDAVPSIYDKGDVQYCGLPEYEGNTYVVGYWVSADEDGQDIHFISIYEICYSKDLATDKPHQGTIFTTHRIFSPELMQMKQGELYQGDPIQSFKSFLDKDIEEVNQFYENYYAYMFVGFYDMSIKVWQYATFFPFNYTPFPKQMDLYKGMVEIDYYLRKFSLQNKEKLTIYSGKYENTINVKIIPQGPSTPSNEEPIPITSFWRIVTDNNFNTILIVTQYSEHKLKNCGEIYLCSDGLEILNRYKNGGCTYTCSVNDEIIEKLGSTKFTIIGTFNKILEFIRQQKSAKLSKSRRASNEGSKTISVNTNDFMSKAGTAALQMNYDSDLTMLADLTLEDSSSYAFRGNNDGYAHPDGGSNTSYAAEGGE